MRGFFFPRKPRTVHPAISAGMNGPAYPGTPVVRCKHKNPKPEPQQYQIEYHIVWGTRYRRKYIKEYTKQELRKYLFSATKKYPTLHINSFNTNEDHVHLQIEIPPNLSVADVVQRLKSESNQILKKKFKFIREMCLDGSIWSVGYFVSTVRLNDDMVKRYIANQGRKDKGTTLRLRFS